jgi:hypothetical protein
MYGVIIALLALVAALVMTARQFEDSGIHFELTIQPLTYQKRKSTAQPVAPEIGRPYKEPKSIPAGAGQIMISRLPPCQAVAGRRRRGSFCVLRRARAASRVTIGGKRSGPPHSHFNKYRSYRPFTRFSLTATPRTEIPA